MSRATALLALALLAGSLLFACSDGQSSVENASVVPSATTVPSATPATAATAEPPTATPTVPAQSSSPEGLYAQDARTGEPAVDAFLDALHQRDAAFVADAIAETGFPCGTEMGMARCQEGQPAGTLVYAVRMGACSIQFFPRETAVAALSPVIEGGEHYPYAVFRQPDASFIPGAQFVAIIATSLDGDVLQVALDAEGRVVGFTGQCGNPLRTTVPLPDGAELILPPRES